MYFRDGYCITKTTVPLRADATTANHGLCCSGECAVVGLLDGWVYPRGRVHAEPRESQFLDPAPVQNIALCAADVAGRTDPAPAPGGAKAGAGAKTGGANRAFWCNQEFSDLLLKAKTTSDIAERTKAYEAAQVIFKEQAPWDTLAHSTQYVPMRKEVTGFVQSPLGDYTFENVDLTE